MTTTAPAIISAAPENVADILKFQDECLQKRQYVFIGWVQRIVLERTANMYVPPDLEEDLKSDPAGLSIEFFGKDNWLPVGQVEAAGRQSFLLPLAEIKNSAGYVEFPEKPDWKWTPDGAAARTPIMEKDANGIERWTGKLTPAPTVKMLPQPLRNFSTGKLRGTNLIVYERVAQILVKAQGLAEGWILKCGSNPAQNPPTFMTFLLDQQTGKSHFYGGTYVITKPGVG
jgi:hypothetical protein